MSEILTRIQERVQNFHPIEDVRMRRQHAIRSVWEAATSLQNRHPGTTEFSVTQNRQFVAMDRTLRLRIGSNSSSGRPELSIWRVVEDGQYKVKRYEMSFQITQRNDETFSIRRFRLTRRSPQGRSEHTHKNSSIWLPNRRLRKIANIIPNMTPVEGQVAA